jgi:hypothetical protein
MIAQNTERDGSTFPLAIPAGLTIISAQTLASSALRGGERDDFAKRGDASMPPLNIDQINSGISQTALLRLAQTNTAAFEVDAANTAAIDGFCQGTGTGVGGFSDQGAGIVGTSTDGSGVSGGSTNGIGVEGGSINSYGVKGGSGNRAGVYGVSGTGEGLYGRSLNGPSVGVYGASPTTGVFGDGSRTGVTGQTTSGIGVQGTSAGGIGIDGSSTGGIGVRGTTSSTRRGGAAIMGIAMTATAQAGVFIGGVVVRRGDLFVDGNLTVFGAKSAAVRFPDGSRRVLHVIESPEAWFEDFGRARLIEGRARIRLEPQFAAAVRTGDFHVFLTPEGNSRGLYVSAKRSTGFDVREQQGGTSNIGFSYRVVARRKDVKARRFEKIALPIARELERRERAPQPVKPPKAPAAAGAGLPRIPRAVAAAMRRVRRRRGSRPRRRT